MLLNRVEKALMNNPLRAAVQRRVETGWLLDLGGPLRGGVALEVGCGRGRGVEIILDRFQAGRVDAFDLDPHMVELAKKRLAGRAGGVRLWVGDVTRIAAPDDAYDAVFDFGIVHHVPDWRAGLREIHRVLKPGGRLYAEEVLARFILNPVVRRLLRHPLEDRFDAARFRGALEAEGFRMVGQRSLGPWVAWFVADKAAQG
jgi:ubiquinone/menaquinone biosynthesis C-methylase UbiE